MYVYLLYTGAEVMHELEKSIDNKFDLMVGNVCAPLSEW